MASGSKCVKEQTKKVDINVVAVVCTNSHSKEGVIGHVPQKSPGLYPCSYPCSIAHWISLQLGSASTMEVNTARFMDLKRALKWLKIK